MTKRIIAVLCGIASAVCLLWGGYYVVFAALAHGPDETILVSAGVFLLAISFALWR